MINKRNLMLLACVTLAACATKAPPSLTQSLAPVHTLVPTINCGEGRANSELPDYPLAPAVVDLESLRAYSKAQSVWAAQAIGVVEDEYSFRSATNRCLNNLRAQGLIN